MAAHEGIAAVVPPHPYRHGVPFLQQRRRGSVETRAQSERAPSVPTVTVNAVNNSTHFKQRGLFLLNVQRCHYH